MSTANTRTINRQLRAKVQFTRVTRTKHRALLWDDPPGVSLPMRSVFTVLPDRQCECWLLDYGADGCAYCATRVRKRVRARGNNAV